MDREAWRDAIHGSQRVRQDWATELNWTEDKVKSLIRTIEFFLQSKYKIGIPIMKLITNAVDIKKLHTITQIYKFKYWKQSGLLILGKIILSNDTFKYPKSSNQTAWKT